MDYNRLKKAFITVALSRPDAQRKKVIDDLDEITNVIDTIAGEIISFVENAHSRISSEVEDLAGSIDKENDDSTEGPVASGVDTATMYTYLKEHGSSPAIRSLLKLLKLEDIKTQAQISALKHWYDRDMAQKQEAFDWSQFTDGRDKSDGK